MSEEARRREAKENLERRIKTRKSKKKFYKEWGEPETWLSGPFQRLGGGKRRKTRRRRKPRRRPRRRKTRHRKKKTKRRKRREKSRKHKSRKRGGVKKGKLGQAFVSALAMGLTPYGIAKAANPQKPPSSQIPSISSFDTTPSTQLAIDNFGSEIPVAGTEGSMPDNTKFTDYSLTTDYGPVTRPELTELIKEIPDDVKEDMEKNIQTFTDKHGRPPKVTFVCAGNTCRSAFSEDLIRKTFGNAVEVNSAGVRKYADDGSKMTPAAQVFACGGKSCQTGHKSQRINRDNIGNSDLVIFMEESLMNDAADHLGYDSKPDNWTVMRSDGVPDPWFPSDTAIPYTSQLGDYEHMTRAVMEPMATHFENLATM